jgi:hypothetical protein
MVHPVVHADFVEPDRLSAARTRGAPTTGNLSVSDDRGNIRQGVSQHLPPMSAVRLR